MHVVIPRTLYYCRSNSRIDINPNFYCLYIITDYETVDLKKYNYFHELRRRTYSDVCHGKLLSVRTPENLEILPTFYQDSVGQWCFVSYKYQLKENSTTDYAATTIQSDGTAPIWFGSRCYRKSASENYVRLQAKAVRRRNGRQYFCDIDFYATRNWKTHSTKVNTWATRGIPSAEAALLKDICLNYAAGADVVTTSGQRAYTLKLHEGNAGIASHLSQLAQTSNSSDSGWSRVSPTPWSLPSFRDEFLLHEPEVLMEGYDDLMLGRGTEAYFRNTLKQEAFLDLFDNVPRLNENSISNVLEIIGFIKALVIDRKIEIPKSLSSLWLAYRYQYSTTKLDAEQAIEFVHRHMDIGDWSRLKCYGTSNLVYRNTAITCRCCATVIPRITDTIGRIWRALYTYGLEPNFYVVWDMIPYSFIVDWFLPIGDIMATWDATRALQQYYDIRDVQYSLKYIRSEPYGDVSCYTRWLSGPPPELSGLYTLERKMPSDKTVVKRFLDGASLIIG